MSDAYHLPLTVLHPGRGPGWCELWATNHESALIVIKEIVIEDSYRIRGLDLAGATVIDVGANIGIFSATCLELGAKVIAVEPEPENVRLLQENVAKWTDGGQATVIPAAVGGEPGKTTVVNTATAAHTEYDGDGPVVEQVTLASVIDSVTGPIAMLKCDTEGVEYAIFDAVPSAALARCERIVVEYHADVATLYLPPDDDRVDRLFAKLSETHDVSVNGSPSIGGTMFCELLP